MAFAFSRFGADLRLLGDLRAQNDRHRGSDLFTAKKPVGPVRTLIDLGTLDGAENLEQALLLRFLTPVGELALLGHPEYGSRLSELIGERNTETNRNRAKMFVLQALAAEPRVQRVIDVKVSQSRADRGEMDIDVTLAVIDRDTPLNLVFPFSLETGGTP